MTEVASVEEGIIEVVQDCIREGSVEDARSCIELARRSGYPIDKKDEEIALVKAYLNCVLASYKIVEAYAEKADFNRIDRQLDVVRKNAEEIGCGGQECEQMKIAAYRLGIGVLLRSIKKLHSCRSDFYEELEEARRRADLIGDRECLENKLEEMLH
jgi:hypothetical protein